MTATLIDAIATVTSFTGHNTAYAVFAVRNDVTPEQTRAANLPSEVEQAFLTLQNASGREVFQALKGMV